MTSVEQEIWNIFTFYTLHGNPLDPEHIRSTQFVKLCRDCCIVGSSLSEASPPLTDADVQVVYTAEVKKVDKTLQKMNYNDFLTVLMKLSIRVYPRFRSVDDAFQRLLTENVLPLAARRCPDAIDMYLAHPDVSRLFAYYSDALEQIFTFYATCDKRAAKALMTHAMSTGSVTSTASALTLTGKSPMRATRGINSMKEALGYAEFLKFASDFDLSSSVLLSTLEIGDIYLSSIAAVQPDSSIRKLTFLEFWEALLRCALVAYSKISDATVIDKIRGLFLYMWRAINRSVPRAFSERRNVSTYAGDLLAGAMLFNKRFTAAWSADGYRDYLSPEHNALESGKAVLSRLLSKGASEMMSGMSYVRLPLGEESREEAALPPPPPPPASLSSHTYTPHHNTHNTTTATTPQAYAYRGAGVGVEDIMAKGPAAPPAVASVYEKYLGDSAAGRITSTTHVNTNAANNSTNAATSVASMHTVGATTTTTTSSKYSAATYEFQSYSAPITAHTLPSSSPAYMPSADYGY